MTNNLGAPRIADGQADGQWATANDMTGRHDAAMTEELVVSFDSSDTVTLTALQFTSHHTFRCIAGSPAPDAACTLNVPNVNALAATLKRGDFVVINDLSQDLTPQVSGQSETPPVLSPGQRSIFNMNGTDVFVIVPSGTVGADGADGTDPGILFNFDTTTTDADPGNGDLRANNASLAAATFLYIDDLDRSGNNVEAHLLTWDDSTSTVKGHLHLSRASDGAQTIFTVGAVTDASGYVKVAVTYVSGATSFSNADAISAQFYRTGDAASSPTRTVVTLATGTTDVAIPAGCTRAKFISGAITVSGSGVSIAVGLRHTGNTVDQLFSGASWATSTSIATVAAVVGLGTTGAASGTVRYMAFDICSPRDGAKKTIGSSQCASPTGSNCRDVIADAANDDDSIRFFTSSGTMTGTGQIEWFYS